MKKQTDTIQLCVCGCGKPSIPNKRYAWGHRSKIIQPCACGCGQMTTAGREYKQGHNGTGKSAEGKRINKICPFCGTPFWNYVSTQTTYCSSVCYGLTKKGKPLSETQIKSYKNRICPPPWNKGLTKETSEKVRLSLSEPKKGENNPMFGKVTSEATKDKIRITSSYPRTKETRQKMSEVASRRVLDGKNENRNKWFKRGTVTLDRLGITTYYSSSYELKTLLLLESFSNVIEVSRASIRIPYVLNDGSNHYYIPDFLITVKNGGSYIVEIKPACQIQTVVNQLKFEAAVRYAKKHNMTFLIWTEQLLFDNNSVTTELLSKETLVATAAILSNGRIMIQSELHSNMEKQAEMTCSPAGDNNE